MLLLKLFQFLLQTDNEGLSVKNLKNSLSNLLEDAEQHNCPMNILFPTNQYFYNLIRLNFSITQNAYKIPIDLKRSNRFNKNHPEYNSTNIFYINLTIISSDNQSMLLQNQALQTNNLIHQMIIHHINKTRKMFVLYKQFEPSIHELQQLHSMQKITDLYKMIQTIIRQKQLSVEKNVEERLGQHMEITQSIKEQIVKNTEKDLPQPKYALIVSDVNIQPATYKFYPSSKEIFQDFVIVFYDGSELNSLQCKIPSNVPFQVPYLIKEILIYDYLDFLLQLKNNPQFDHNFQLLENFNNLTYFLKICFVIKKFPKQTELLLQALQIIIENNFSAIKNDLRETQEKINNVTLKLSQDHNIQLNEAQNLNMILPAILLEKANAIGFHIEQIFDTNDIIKNYLTLIAKEIENTENNIIIKNYVICNVYHLYNLIKKYIEISINNQQNAKEVELCSKFINLIYQLYKLQCHMIVLQILQIKNLYHQQIIPTVDMMLNFLQQNHNFINFDSSIWRKISKFINREHKSETELKTIDLNTLQILLQTLNMKYKNSETTNDFREKLFTIFDTIMLQNSSIISVILNLLNNNLVQDFSFLLFTKRITIRQNLSYDQWIQIVNANETQKLINTQKKALNKMNYEIFDHRVFEDLEPENTNMTIELIDSIDELF
jgi:hypothetical protein